MQETVSCTRCGHAFARGDRFCPKCGSARDQTETVVVPAALKNMQANRLARATEGEFEILHQLGLGAMGSVFLARDIALSRKVAIKVIASNLLQDESMVSRFRLEAQTVASLRHPNIVNVHAVRESEDLHFFVMDFIDGPPLRNVVKAHAPLDVPVVQALLYQVGSALDYAHHRGKGVIHRDIKPANIMVDREGDAFVTDFGISKITESPTGLTQTGATIGTPEYMSPEQCRGETLTGASDQYALGVVAYEMLVGHTPFTGSQYFIMVAHTSEEPKAILDLRPDCPRHVAEAVHRMLAKTPEDRFPDLESALSAMGGGPLGRRDPVRQRITALAASTAEVSALDTASPLSPLPGPSAGDADSATTITVLGVPTRIEEGDSFQLSADVRSGTQGSLPGASVTWTSTDSAVAVVDNGSVRALRAGTALIQASAGGVTHSVSIVVGHAAPAEVVVEPGELQVESGGRVSLAAEVHDKHGRVLERPVRWLTSDASVASVSKDGQVVATGAGSAVITAESGGVTGTADIVVRTDANAVASFGSTGAESAASSSTITPSAPSPPAGTPPTLPPGYRRPAVAALLLLLFGTAGALGARGMGWLGSGAELTPPPAATSESEAEPTPAGPAVTDLDVEALDEPLTIGEERTLTAQALDEEGAAIPAAQIEWVSSDPSVARVAPGGLLTALASGAATLTASSGDVRREVSVTVAPGRDAGSEVGAAANNRPGTDAPSPAPAERAPARATTLEIVGMPSSMRVGERAAFSARVLDQRGAPMPNQPARVRWGSADPAVVRLDEGNVFLAVGPGTTTLSAGIGELRADQTVAVEVVVERIEVRPTTLEIEAGASGTLEARVFGPDDFRLPPRLVRWQSADEAVVGVDAGRVVARGTGTTTVTASAGGMDATVQVSVSEASVTVEIARRLTQEYVGILNSTDEAAVTRIYDAASSDRLDDLLDLVDNNDFSARLVETEDLGGVPIALTSGPARARAEFRLQMTYRTGFGGERIQLRDFQMTIGPANGGGWRIISVIMIDD